MAARRAILTFYEVKTTQFLFASEAMCVVELKADIQYIVNII